MSSRIFDDKELGMLTRARWAGFAALLTVGPVLVVLSTGIDPVPFTSAQAQETRSAPITGPAGQGGNGNLSPKASAQAPAIPNFIDLVQAVKPAVVSIRVRADATPRVTGDGTTNPFEGTPFERFFRRFGPGQGQDQMPERHQYVQAQGSGFFMSADGYVVTNNHVVNQAVRLEVVTDDGQVLDAKVVGADPKTDLALLKVEGSNYPFVTLSDESAKIGEWVIAMGNPFGLGGTVTAGIVSAQGRDIGTGPYDDFLQIDAAVNRGNSGGPTFNMSGRVIGVNTAIYSPSGGSVGIAFAIPANTVQLVMAQLKERGYVERGWIGVQVQPVTRAIADSLGLKEAEGALVSGVQPNSPAAKAGLRTGDVVTAINGAGIKDSRELARQVAGIAPNTTVGVTYARDGQEHTTQVTIGELKEQTAHRASPPDNPGGDTQTTRLGLSVAPAARVLGIGEEGLAVLHVDPNGKAAEVGLRAGDIILRIGSNEVASPDDLRKTLEEAGRQNRDHVLALVRRNDREMFIALPLRG
jgi:serine protease Do